MRVLFLFFLAALLSPRLVAAQPASSLGSLSSRLEPGGGITVRTTDGRVLEGDFVRVSDEELTAMVHGRQLVFPVAEIREVRGRGDRMFKKGLLFGFVGGAIVATTIMLASGGTASAEDKVAFGTLAGGLTGLTWGGIVGAFIREQPVVYQAPRATVRWLPVVMPHQIGVIVNVNF